MSQLTNKMSNYNNLRKKAVLEKHDVVLEHALNLFLEKGIELISMNDIAVSSGISRASIYRYFTNKETIITNLASGIMGIIFNVAFNDISFESPETFSNGYKQMAIKFHELSFAYRYMSMFGNYLGSNEPSDQTQDIYIKEFKSLITPNLANLDTKSFNRHMMLLNLTMDFLEDLALHEKTIPITQGISIETLLDEFCQVIDAILTA